MRQAIMATAFPFLGLGMRDVLIAIANNMVPLCPPLRTPGATLAKAFCAQRRHWGGVRKIANKSVNLEAKIYPPTALWMRQTMTTCNMKCSSYQGVGHLQKQKIKISQRPTYMNMRKYNTSIWPPAFITLSLSRKPSFGIYIYTAYPEAYLAMIGVESTYIYIHGICLGISFLSYFVMLKASATYDRFYETFPAGCMVMWRPCVCLQLHMYRYAPPPKYAEVPP